MAEPQQGHDVAVVPTVTIAVGRETVTLDRAGAVELAEHLLRPFGLELELRGPDAAPLPPLDEHEPLRRALTPAEAQELGVLEPTELPLNSDEASQLLRSLPRDEDGRLLSMPPQLGIRILRGLATLQNGDGEWLHSDADEVLRATAPGAVREAYDAVRASAAWWVFA